MKCNAMIDGWVDILFLVTSKVGALMWYCTRKFVHCQHHYPSLLLARHIIFYSHNVLANFSFSTIFRCFYFPSISHYGFHHFPNCLLQTNPRPPRPLLTPLLSLQIASPSLSPVVYLLQRGINDVSVAMYLLVPSVSICYYNIYLLYTILCIWAKTYYKYTWPCCFGISTFWYFGFATRNFELLPHLLPAHQHHSRASFQIFFVVQRNYYYFIHLCVCDASSNKREEKTEWEILQEVR